MGGEATGGWVAVKTVGSRQDLWEISKGCLEGQERAGKKERNQAMKT